MASGNHFVPISQILLPLEAVFPSLGIIFYTNPLLQPDFLFTGNDILSFRFFWKSVLQLEGGQYLRKILFPWKYFFPLEETVFSSNSSFRRVETDFLLSLLLLRPNVVLVETIIQIKVEPFFIE